MLQKIFFILFVLVLAWGCSSNVSKKDSGRLIIYPPPPEKTRIQYLTSFSSSKDILGEQSGFLEYVTGEEDEVGEIIKPYGIAIYKGKIYICDTILGGIEIIDLKEKTFEYFQPSGLGQFKKPINCYKDKSGKLFVVDAERNQVLVFDDNEEFVTAFGERVLVRPTDVTVYNNRIYVSDLKGHNIKVFDFETKEFIEALPSSEGGSANSLFSPSNICLCGDYLYVSDIGDAKVKWYTLEGELVDSVGSFGRGLGQFVRPKGIAVDDSLNLYVVDAGFENIQIFNREGDLLMFFGGAYKKPGDMWLPAKVIIDYDNLEYFQQYVNDRYLLKYLIFVTNQYGPDKISVYGYVNEK